MDFDLDLSIEVLRRSPATLRALLDGLDEPWVRSTEGPDTLCPFDVPRSYAPVGMLGCGPTHAARPCAGRRVAHSLSAIREAAVTPLQRRLKPGALP